jgi:phenylacetate-CoA ligase
MLRMPAWLARNLYFSLQRIRGEPVGNALRDVRQTEFLSLTELQTLQAKRQLEQLRFVLRHVPYYQEKYRSFTGLIETVKEWDEVNQLMIQLPTLEKDSVKDNVRELTATNIKQLKTYPDKTSGSSGSPLTFPCDQNAWAYRHALAFRCMEAYGVQIGEPYAYVFGLHWNNRTRLQIRLRDWIFNRVRLSAFDIGEQLLNEHLKQLLSFKPTYLLGYPSAIYEFCTLLYDKDIDELRKLNLKAVFLTAEPLRSYQRELIEKVADCRCVNMYGSAEGGLNVLECPHGSLHLQIEVTWLQLHEPIMLSGEALVTDMMLRAFPLIRYNIGDDIVLSTEICSCGRAHPLVKSIEGRSGEPITLPNGRKVNANLPSYVFKSLGKYGVIRRYRFVAKPGEPLKLFLVVTDRFSDEHLRIVEQETRNAFGSDIVFFVHFVDNIPHLANAKHRDYVEIK